jgi:hypothetical protein
MGAHGEESLAANTIQGSRRLMYQCTNVRSSLAACSLPAAP